MATKVHMEALSPTMEEGRLVSWLKKEGDQVSEGDVLAEIETDKATMELVARGAGVLRKLLVAEGQSAPVGTVIAVIAAADEDIGDVGGAAPAAEPPKAVTPTAEAPKAEAPKAEAPKAEAPKAEAPKAEAPKAEAPTAEASEAETSTAAATKTVTPTQPPAQPAGNGGGRVKASPLARKMAAESGLELRSVQGSGPGGRITKRDIEVAAQSPQPVAARLQATRVSGGAEYEDLPLSQMRKTIAKRLVTSIGPVPTFYLTTEADMTRVQQARESVNARLEENGIKASINDFIIKAVAAALRHHPEVNASWTDTAIRRYSRVHIGVAVAVEDGLITPVVRDADAKGLAEIATEVRELAKRARDRKLQPDEYTGATFSISNLGMFGIDEFTAIINPPEAAILAVGRIEEKAVVENGQLVPRARMRMTMSCDHRVIDGATGAKFLQTLKAFLDEPTLILV